MFTGLITHVKNITSKEVDGGVEFVIERPKEWSDIELGESIATNGVCLTVTEITDDSYTVFLMPETLQASAFGSAVPQRVNLERAMVATTRLGGHFVQGHVDGVGTVSSIDESNGWRLFIEFPQQNQDLVIYKGSITINGVSLTVASIEGNVLSVALIPQTLEHTTLSDLKVGDSVNLEYDMIGKYVAKIMEGRTNAKSNNS